ncbi:MAG: hypothetical protein CM15mP74_34160 [Halieaceae bacterium]|nr:MAG: hypothetical protein CM15mP74_34160 [Halieaceae bacterium]
MIRRTDKADKELIHLIDVLDAIERLTINIEVPPLGGHRYVVERLLPSQMDSDVVIFSLDRLQAANPPGYITAAPRRIVSQDTLSPREIMTDSSPQKIPSSY